MMYKLLDSVQDNWPNCCSLFYMWSKYKWSKDNFWLENALVLPIAAEVIKLHLFVQTLSVAFDPTASSPFFLTSIDILTSAGSLGMKAVKLDRK